MHIAERLLSLRTLAPFEALTGAELALIATSAEIAAPREHELLARHDDIVKRLIVVLRGSLAVDGVQSPNRIFGVESLLFSTPIGCELSAMKHHETVILNLSKAHFLTLVNEVPAFLSRFAQQQEARV